MTHPLLSIEVRRQEDVVLARQRARKVAASLTWNAREQASLATAVSELARDAQRRAGGGTIDVALRDRAGGPSRG